MDEDEDEIKWRELARINFVLERDGSAGMLSFCAQGMKVYSAALKSAKRTKKGYGRENRRELISSLLVYRHVLRL
jgi:hypothetical protein